MKWIGGKQAGMLIKHFQYRGFSIAFVVGVFDKISISSNKRHSVGLIENKEKLVRYQLIKYLPFRLPIKNLIVAQFVSHWHGMSLSPRMVAARNDFGGIPFSRW